MKQIRALEEMAGHEVVAVCNNSDDQYIITLTNDTYILIGIDNNYGDAKLDTRDDICDYDFSQGDLLHLGIITQESIDLKDAREKAAREERVKAKEAYDFEQYATLHLKFTGEWAVR